MPTQVKVSRLNVSLREVIWLQKINVTLPQLSIRPLPPHKCLSLHRFLSSMPSTYVANSDFNMS